MFSRILGSLFLAFGVASACATDLQEFPEGKACDNGQCLVGFVCDRAHNACVRKLPVQKNDAGGPVACGEGLTTCGGHCVELAGDPKNCSGCGIGCTAPPGATATCTNGICDFSCAVAPGGAV